MNGIRPVSKVARRVLLDVRNTLHQERKRLVNDYSHILSIKPVPDKSPASSISLVSIPSLTCFVPLLTVACLALLNTRPVLYCLA